MDLPHEKKFHFANGSAAGTLEELKDELEVISYQEFYNHVNTEKNDFANWIRHTLNEDVLAEDLEKVTSIVETVEILNDFIHPRPAEAPHDDIQSKIEEEELHIHIPVEEVPTAAPAEAVHTEEETTLHEIQEHVEAHEEEHPPEKHEEAPQEKSHEGEHVLSQHDYTRLIVKDFMYGLVFGLVIGLILGRILSF